jgi:hypothetical protein
VAATLQEERLSKGAPPLQVRLYLLGGVIRKGSQLQVIGHSALFLGLLLQQLSIVSQQQVLHHLAKRLFRHLRVLSHKVSLHV